MTREAVIVAIPFNGAIDREVSVSIERVVIRNRNSVEQIPIDRIESLHRKMSSTSDLPNILGDSIEVSLCCILVILLPIGVVRLIQWILRE